MTKVSTREKNFLKDVECDFIAFTDGACHPNPGVGGWGFVLINKATAEREYHYGGERVATNNRMELMAMLRAAARVTPGCSVLMLTDSKLLVNTFNQYIKGWRYNGWRKKDGGEIKNLDLIMEMVALQETRKIYFKWIPGHAGISGNEQADGLAIMGRRQLPDIGQDSFRVHMTDYGDFRTQIKLELERKAL